VYRPRGRPERTVAQVSGGEDRGDLAGAFLGRHRGGIERIVHGILRSGTGERLGRKWAAAGAREDVAGPARGGTHNVLRVAAGPSSGVSAGDLPEAS